MVNITFKSGGQRTLVEEPEAQEILQRFRDIFNEVDNTEDPAVVHKVDLSGRAWTVESLSVLRPLLEQIAGHVKYLKVDDIIASLSTEDGLKSLQFLAEVFAESPIEVLELSDNAIGTRGVEKLRPILSRPSLKSLSMNNCGLSAEVGETLYEILAPVAAQLTALALGRNQIGLAGAEQIARLLPLCRNLQSFTYDGSRPMEQGTNAIATGLASMTETNKNLQILDLNDCFLRSRSDDDHAVYPLCKALERSPALIKLVLRDGSLEKEGLSLVLEALRTSGARLRELDLGASGDIGEEGAEELGPFLEETQSYSLRELVLDTNELGDVGVAILVGSLAGMQQLQTLNLGCNEVETVGARALLHNEFPTLQTLNLEDNMDLSGDIARQLTQKYPEVLVDVDLEGEEEVEEEADDAAVDALAAEVGHLNI